MIGTILECGQKAETYICHIAEKPGGKRLPGFSAICFFRQERRAKIAELYSAFLYNRPSSLFDTERRIQRNRFHTVLKAEVLL